MSNLTRVLQVRLVLAALVASSVLAACSRAPQAPVAAAPSAGTTAVSSSSTSPPATLTQMDAASRTAASKVDGKCAFDSIDGVPFQAGTPANVQDPSAVKLAGWVADEATMTRPQPAALRLDSEDHSDAWQIALGAPVSRGDVAKFFKVDALASSGYLFVVDLKPLPPGQYHLSIVHSQGGILLSCPGPTIQISG